MYQALSFPTAGVPLLRLGSVRTHAQADSILTAAPVQLKQFGFAHNFPQQYELGDYIGSGSFGTVHSAINKKTGECVAVKTVRKRVVGAYLESHFVRRVLAEVDIYNHMGRSLNVAHMYGAYEDDKCVDLVMQLCSGGDLWSRVRRGAYGEEQAARIIREVLRAVAQCHSRGVVLRDVKPENFLFLDASPAAPLKMIDLGLATYCQEGQYLTDRAGTAVYCAPEVLRQRYGLKADVWSAGIIAYQLLTARLPFITVLLGHTLAMLHFDQHCLWDPVTCSEDGDMLAADLRLSRARLSNRDIFTAILYGPLDFEAEPWPSLSQQAKHFVQWLLTREPEKRPSAAQALTHPWLAVPQQAQAAEHHCVHPATPKEAAEVGLEPGAQLLDDTLVQRLQRYGTYSKLKQVSLSRVARFMADFHPDVLAELKAALGTAAKATGGAAGSFKIPYNQMIDVLSNGRFELSPVEVRQLLSSFTIDQDGCMDATEWLAALTDWQQVQDTDEWEQLLTKAFNTMDTDSSGQLSVPELETLLCGDEDGCPFDDVVPSALRAMQHDVLNNGSQMTTVSTVPADASSQTPAAPGRLTAVPANGKAGGLVLDRLAFARLLKTAQQDRLELFESRRTAGITTQGTQGTQATSKQED